MSPISPTEDVRMPHGRRTRRGRLLAGTVAASLALAGLAVVNSQSASAASTDDTTAPNAQAVGNFIDATVLGNTLDGLVKLKYATATAPGSTSVQNPLDIELLNAIDLPLTGVLQLPSLLGIHLGAVTQKAYANVDGQSFGQSGLLLDSGGVSIGGDNNAADMAGNATIDLSASSLLGSAGSAGDALGEVKLTIGGISANAMTSKFDSNGNSTASTAYQIANLTLTADSPLLAQLTGMLTSLTGVLNKVASGAISVTGASSSGCDLSATGIPSKLSLEGGAVVLDLANAAITLDFGALLKQLHFDINNMAPNTDLIGYIANYITDPNGLAAGIMGLIDGLVDPLAACGKAFLNNIPLIGPILGQLIDLLTSGGKQLESTVSGLLGQLAGIAGTDPLKPIADLLENLIDIGINVQPNGPAGPANYAYVDHLDATAKQGTPVVPGQTVVRALEINIATVLGGLTGGSSGSHPSSGLLTIALGNAAAGPSHPSAAPTSSAPTTAPPSNGVSPVETTKAPPGKLPTGVNAGKGTTGTPVAPIVLLIVGLLLAGGGAAAWRLRGAGGTHAS